MKSDRDSPRARASATIAGTFRECSIAAPDTKCIG
jgi:hypothetical protein